MSRSRPTVFVDLSQFVAEPWATGVQRVLRGLLVAWPHTLEGRAGFHAADGTHLVDLGDAADALDMVFADRTSNEAASERLRAATTTIVPPEALHLMFDAYLLPEPTFRDEFLREPERWLEERPDRFFAILCDALPQLEPHAFAGTEQTATSRYFRLIGRAENVSVISATTRDHLVRLARQTERSGWTITLPGADGLTPRTSGALRSGYVALGTVEPRKRIDVVLDAFEPRWRDGSETALTVIGRPGWAAPEVGDRLRALADDPDIPVQWWESASDRDLGDLLARTRALIYLSENEGYGLPPLEALALGCPVVVSAQLPALDGLATGGQVRLDPVTADALGRAIDELEHPEVLDAHLAAIETLRLPTWRSYGQQIGAWLSSRLALSNLV